MKISEMIQELQKKLEEEGDLRVMICDMGQHLDIYSINPTIYKLRVTGYQEKILEIA